MMNLARLSGDEQYFIRLIRDRNYFLEPMLVLLCNAPQCFK